MSYSHDADDLLASRLQSGLQRFAKPWWKRRALRVFRDESSLSASPHLWASIVEAMEGSAWLVLLLSPQAAGSEWVNREVAWWVEHKIPERVLPVVTNGRFAWTDGHMTGDAVPPALTEAFGQEPRWVDLRWARREEHLDLRDSRFRGAVADIASALSGIPKDDLESEEVRQHRRTLRTAWAAAVTLIVLVVAASTTAIYAVGQRQQAQQQAQRAQAAEQEAQQEAENARTAEQQALQEADRADAEAETARQNEALARASEAKARAGELSVLSAATLDEDPELSILLALEAVEVMRSTGQDLLPDTIRALHRATQASRLERRFDGGYDAVSISFDGALFATDTEGDSGYPSGTVLVRDTATGEQVAALSDPRMVLDVRFSPTSNLLAIGYGYSISEKEDQVEEPDTVVIWDAVGGEVVARLPGSSYIMSSGSMTDRPLAWSPDGRLLAAMSWDGRARMTYTVWDVDSQEVVSSFPAPGGDVVFRDNSTLLISEPGQVGFYDATTGRKIDDLETPGFMPGSLALDPRGEVLVIGSQASSAVQAWDLETRTRLWSNVPHVGGWQTVSPDSTMVAVTSFAGPVQGFDLVDGTEMFALGGHTGAWGVAFDPTGRTLMSAGAGETKLWDVSPAGPPALGAVPAGSEWPVHPLLSPDGTQVAFSAVSSTGAGSFRALDLTTGEVVDSIPGQWVDFWRPAPVSPDWRYVAWVDPDGNAWFRPLGTDGPATRLPACASPKAFSPDSAALLVDGLDICTDLVDVPEGAEMRSRVIDPTSGEVLLDLGGRTVFARGGGFNPAGVFEPGRYVTANRIENGTVEVWDLATDSLVTVVGIEADTAFSGGIFDPTGRYLIGSTILGRAWVLDLAAAVEGTPADQALVINVQAHEGPAVSHAISGNGLVATSGHGDPVRIWDMTDGELWIELDVGMPLAPFVLFSHDEKYLYYTDTGYDGYVIRRFPLDSDRLIELAESRITRILTDDECRRFPSAPSCEEGR